MLGKANYPAHLQSAKINVNDSTPPIKLVKYSWSKFDENKLTQTRNPDYSHRR